MSSEHKIHAEVYISQANSHPEAIDRSAHELETELREMDVQVEPQRLSKTPKEAKPVDPVLVGALVIAILPSVLTKLLDFLQAWAMRHENQVVKVRLQSRNGRVIEVEFPSSMSKEQLAKHIHSIAVQVTKAGHE